MFESLKLSGKFLGYTSGSSLNSYLLDRLAARDISPPILLTSG